VTTATAVKHPAKFSDSVLAVLNEVMADEAERREARLFVLDPMAGVGRIHELDRSAVYKTIGIELEQEWARAHPWTLQGDATALLFRDSTFDAVVTSPCYGNRMADHHNAKDDSRRITYKHVLGRDLSPNSGAGLQWGDAYRELHRRILGEMVRVTKPGGLVIVNVSNHIRKGTEQFVAEWWLARMLLAGLRFKRAIPVRTPRMGFGENYTVRVDCEWVFVTRKAVV
jgi:tRNA G10  N-methylase Trm11